MPQTPAVDDEVIWCAPSGQELKATVLQVNDDGTLNLKVKSDNNVEEVYTEHQNVQYNADPRVEAETWMWPR